MRKEDYTIFEYRMSKEIKYADLIYNGKNEWYIRKSLCKNKNRRICGYVDLSSLELGWEADFKAGI